MRSAGLAVLGVLVLASSALAVHVDGFYSTWDDVRKAAKEQGKPIYLHFTTDWCGWCRQIERETYTSQLGKTALKDFVPASLDCTEPKDKPADAETQQNLKLMAQLGGSGYPFLVMVTYDGAVLNTVDGYVPPERFAAELAKAVAVNAKLKEFDASAEQDKANYDRSLQAMRLYSHVRLWDKAAAAAERVGQLDAKNQHGDGAEAGFALLRAAIGQPAEGDTAVASKQAKVEQLQDRIVQLDPNNAKGIFEQSLSYRVGKIMSEAALAAGRAEVEKRCREALPILARLTDKADKLHNAQQVWIMAGQCNLTIGNRQEGLAALEKAYRADPNSELAPSLKQAIDKLKS